MCVCVCVCHSIHRVAADQEEDDLVKRIILNLGTKGVVKNSDRELLPLAELRKLMLVKPFCLNFFLNRVEKNLRHWIQDTMKERPLLNTIYGPRQEQEEQQTQENVTNTNPAGNDDDDDDDDNNAVGRLNRARATLHAHGDDPLSESLELATQAIGTQPTPPKTASQKQKRAKASFYDKHEAATRLSFGDSQVDDIMDDSDDDDNSAAAHLSTLPSPVKSDSGSHSHSHSRRNKRKGRSSPTKKTQVKKYEGRRKWTQEEKRAIQQGIRELGKGKWAEIKDLYSVLLAERTSGQISVRPILSCPVLSCP